MKRWPIIRHIRWFLEMNRYAHWWNEVGREHWLAPNPHDVEYLQDIWEGRQQWPFVKTSSPSAARPRTRRTPTGAAG